MYYIFFRYSPSILSRVAVLTVLEENVLLRSDNLISPLPPPWRPQRVRFRHFHGGSGWGIPLNRGDWWIGTSAVRLYGENSNVNVPGSDHDFRRLGMSRRAVPRCHGVPARRFLVGSRGCDGSHQGQREPLPRWRRSVQRRSPTKEFPVSWERLRLNRERVRFNASRE